MALTGTGLYIGADFADLVVVSLAKGKPRIAKAARSPLFEGQSAGINKVFEAAGQKKSGVNTCLPQVEVMLRRFIMPYLAPQERANAVKFEAQKYIPFKIDEVISDFYVTYEIKATMSMDTLFAAANKQAAQKHLQMFRDLGIGIDVVDIMPLALLRVASLSGEWGGKQESKALVYIEKDSRGVIIIIKNDHPYLVREINPSPSKEIFFTNVLNNLRLSVDYFKRETKEIGVEKVLICGEGDLPGIGAYLKESALFGARIAVIDFKDEIDGLNDLSRKQLIAIGLAMASFEKPKPKINLISRTSKAGLPIKLEGYKPLVIEAVVLLAVLIALYLAMAAALSNKTRAIDNVKSRRPVVAGVNLDGSLDSLMDAEKEFNSRLGFFKALAGKDRIFLTKKLNKLGQILPDGAWIESFKFFNEPGRPRTLNIRGMIYSKNNDEPAIANKILFRMKQDTDFSEGFQDIKLSSIKKVAAYSMEFTEFNIDCADASSKSPEEEFMHGKMGRF